MNFTEIVMVDKRLSFSLDLKILTSDVIDILQHFIPTENEVKAFTSYLADGKSLLNLSDEDRFLYGVTNISLFFQSFSSLDILVIQSGKIKSKTACTFFHGEFR